MSSSSAGEGFSLLLRALCLAVAGPKKLFVEFPHLGGQALALDRPLESQYRGMHSLVGRGGHTAALPLPDLHGNKIKL